MISEIQKLEKELAKAKEKESNDNFMKLHREIVDFFKPLLNKTVGYVSKRKDVIEHINIIRINELSYDNHYLEQGYYGQFSPKRFIIVKGTCLTIGSKYIKDSNAYNTSDGEIFISEEYRGLKKINTPPELSGTMLNGIPIGIKKNWNKEFTRIVDCGTYTVNNCCFKFGDKDVFRENNESMLTNFNSFKQVYKCIPDELFDKIIKLHVKQCKETYDLMSSIKNIEFKNL